jgi:hypothetical protein
VSNYSLPDYSKVKNDLAVMPEGDPFDIYSQGFVGSYYNPEDDDRLKQLVESEGMSFQMSSVAPAFGFEGQGAGKTVLLYKEVEKVGWLERQGYPNQAVGDCVSHGTAKAIGFTLCCAITHGQGSKPETNGIESKMWPIASEPHYWYRGKSSDGWYASAALRVVKEKTGIVVRKNIPGACDLTSYSRSTAHCYGSRPPPESVRDYLDDNPVMTYAKCHSYEEIIDALSAGYGVQHDGGEGFGKSVDENGVARRSGHWSHSMSCCGFIDTPEFKSRYGCGGLIIQNSWGSWNHNDNAKIMGTNERLPKGAFVALWKDVSRRSYFAISAVKGWPNRKLPSWNMGDLI